MTEPAAHDDEYVALARQLRESILVDGQTLAETTKVLRILAALADAGCVVVMERLDDALAAIRSLVGDHDVHPAHLPDCTICIALNGRVAPRLRAALEPKTTRAKVAAILDAGEAEPPPLFAASAEAARLIDLLTPRWMALWAAAETEWHREGVSLPMRWSSPSECTSCGCDWPCPMSVALAALSAAAESEIEP